MDEKNLKVRRSSWRDLRQDALPAYTENVLNKTANNPAYHPLQALLNTLSSLNQTYADCLAAAMGRERAAVAYKNEIKSQLYGTLEEVAVGLEANAKGDEMYILNAGMELHRSRTNHTGQLMPPVKLSAAPGLSGQAELRFLCPRGQRTQVETFAVEWQAVGEAAWHNGTYRNAQRILVEGLPQRQDVRFRVRCLGTRGRKSEWSEVATAFVV